jgi:hypothetical protein
VNEAALMLARCVGLNGNGNGDGEGEGDGDAGSLLCWLVCVRSSKRRQLASLCKLLCPCERLIV